MTVASFTRGALIALGGLALVGGAVWWGVSISCGYLVGSDVTSVPGYYFLGVDFEAGQRATRHWLHGGNPYLEKYDDPLDRPHSYPPPAYYLFAWSAPLSQPAGYAVWTVVQAGLLAAAAWACVATRARLGLLPLPGVFLLAAAFWSTPFLYGLERGNFDMAVVGLIVAAAALLRRGTTALDLAAGACLAYAAWIKAYPGLLLLALLVLGRLRAALGFLAAFALLGLLHWSAAWDWVRVMSEFTQDYDLDVVPLAHPLSNYWKHLWEGTSLDFLAWVPGIPAALAVLAVPAVLVSWRVFRSPRRDDLAYPYFLWLAALGTFVPKLSNDYNLVFLPLAALAVWQPEDGELVHALLLLLLLWWVPLATVYGFPYLMLAAKLGGLLGVGLSLARKARPALVPLPEQTQPAAA